MPPSAMTGTPPFAAAFAAAMIAGQLRHADAGDDPRGADRARADADLDRVGAGVGQRLGRLGGGDVAGDDLDAVRQRLHPLDRRADVAVVAVGGVDDDAVARRRRSALRERSKPLSPTVVAAATRSRPCASLVASGEATAFSMSLTVISPTQWLCVVDHQQLLDPPLVEDPPRVLLAGAERRPWRDCPWSSAR